LVVVTQAEKPSAEHATLGVRSLEYSHMPMLNRSAIILIPKQPYADWANSLDDDGPRFEISEADDELDAELSTLAASFDQWKPGAIGPRELSDRIHTFHHGAARELYGLYTRVHPPQLVARAVGLHVLSDTEVPPPLLEALASSIEYYRAQPDVPQDDDDA
jgi:hypothetical protein